MRLVGLICLVSLRAAAQRCDPHGVMPVPFPEAEVPIELELFKDELAARGVCPVLRARQDFSNGSDVLLQTSLQQSLDLRCDGVCEPMRAKLAPFDEAHDLELSASVADIVDFVVARPLTLPL